MTPIKRGGHRGCGLRSSPAVCSWRLAAVCSRLGRRCRHWPSIEPTLAQNKMVVAGGYCLSYRVHWHLRANLTYDGFIISMNEAWCGKLKFKKWSQHDKARRQRCWRVLHFMIFTSCPALLWFNAKRYLNIWDLNINCLHWNLKFKGLSFIHSFIHYTSCSKKTCENQ